MGHTAIWRCNVASGGDVAVDSTFPTWKVSFASLVYHTSTIAFAETIRAISSPFQS